jgi:signal transduction histidine kinase
LALDRPTGEQFTQADERLIASLASSAALAISMAQAAKEEKLRLSIDASERERGRWARELHDETLQELGALQVMLETIGQDPGAARSGELLERAVEHVRRGIANLKGIITDLRPATLDELGIEAAIETLAERLRGQSGLEITSSVRFASGRADLRLPPETEATIYRVVQEGLNNAIKHASASAVAVEVQERDGIIAVEVRDDGQGFEPGAAGGGFGLLGMRERIAAAGGSLEVESAPGAGTTVRASVPAERRLHA